MYGRSSPFRNLFYGWLHAFVCGVGQTGRIGVESALINSSLVAGTMPRGILPFFGRFEPRVVGRTLFAMWSSLEGVFGLFLPPTP